MEGSPADRGIYSRIHLALHRLPVKRAFHSCIYARRSLCLTSCREHRRKIMLPETMFAMEKMAHNRVAGRQSQDDHRWETWPSTGLDHFGLFLWRVVQRLCSRD